MKVLTDISEDYYKAIKEIPIKHCTGDMLLIKHGTPIQDNATNGDIIKAMFPNIEANEIKTNTGGYIEVKYLDTTDKCDATAFRKNWWNASYKKGDENE